ncbi:MAG: GGDEF domain-containing protein [Clostridiaceae bacterium]|nr:GGDEF domain-containing protein [Clostridiaceae bacterium]
MSYHDALTGLYNRTFFEQEIKRLECKKRAQETDNRPTGIIICDVDGLKLVNDMLGHDRGDFLLTEAAKIINSVFLEKCLVARIGGDEFAVLLEENEEGLLQAWQDIHHALRLYNAQKPELPLSISVGCAADHLPSNLNLAFREADCNMYKEKIKQSPIAHDSIIESLMLNLDKKDLSHCRAEQIQKVFLEPTGSMKIAATSESDSRIVKN